MCVMHMYEGEVCNGLTYMKRFCKRFGQILSKMWPKTGRKPPICQGFGQNSVQNTHNEASMCGDHIDTSNEQYLEAFNSYMTYGFGQGSKILGG